MLHKMLKITTSDANESLQDISKLSKKEQRKLEREAKKAAKLAAKNATGAAIPVAGPSSTPSPVIPIADASKETERSPSSSPIHNATKPEEAVKTSIKSPRSSADNLLPSLQITKFSYTRNSNKCTYTYSSNSKRYYWCHYIETCYSSSKTCW